MEATILTVTFRKVMIIIIIIIIIIITTSTVPVDPLTNQL